jgi:hypothetical protein
LIRIAVSGGNYVTQNSEFKQVAARFADEVEYFKVVVHKNGIDTGDTEETVHSK